MVLFITIIIITVYSLFIKSINNYLLNMFDFLIVLAVL